MLVGAAHVARETGRRCARRSLEAATFCSRSPQRSAVDPAYADRAGERGVAPGYAAGASRVAAGVTKRIDLVVGGPARPGKRSTSKVTDKRRDDGASEVGAYFT